MQSHSATVEEKTWMDQITNLGCIVCLKVWGLATPAEVHHINGKAKKGSQLETIPLCYAHHRGGKDTPSWSSRHPYKSRFEQRYGTELELLDYTRNEISRRYYDT